MQQAFDYANQVGIYAIYAISLNLLLGVGGQLSIAHAAFGGIGGYLAAYVAITLGSPFIAVLAIGFAGAVVVGVLTSLPALYLDERYLILLTLALATVVIAVIGAIPALGGTYGLSGVPVLSIGGREFATPQQFFVPLAVIVAIVFLVCLRLSHSPFGRVLRGIRDDDVATRGIGKNTVLAKVVLFGLTAGMAGVAGVMLVYYDGATQPGAFSLTVAMTIIAMVVIGGSGNLFGSVVGAALVVLLEPFLEKVIELDPSKAGPIRVATYGTLLILFIVLRPQGLVPEGIGSRWRARFASWRGREAPAAEDQRAGRAAAVEGMRERVRLDGSAPAGDEGETVLEATGLAKRFGGIDAADGLTLRLRRGRVTGLVGPNGAGKTTAFNLITGALPPDAGTVLLDGRDITGWSPDRVSHAGMARTYQDVRLFPRMSVLDNVAIAVPSQPGEKLPVVLFAPLTVARGERAARAKALEVLRYVGLQHRSHELAGSLGFGDQKLLALARLLATDADVLLLDEPSSGTDMERVDLMLDLIGELARAGKAVCVVEHNLHVLERAADWVYFMEAGHVTAEGTLADLTSQTRLTEAYFGTVS